MMNGKGHATVHDYARLLEVAEERSDYWLSRAAAAEVREGQLRRTLEPFVAAADEWEDRGAPWNDFEEGVEWYAEIPVSNHDVLRARAALARSSSDKEAGDGRP